MRDNWQWPHMILTLNTKLFECTCLPWGKMSTCRLSWKLEAWYWAYLAMVVCERLLSQGHVCAEPLGSQFSSAGCWTWVLTSTACSALASTRDLVENRPRSHIGKRKQRTEIIIILIRISKLFLQGIGILKHYVVFIYLFSDSKLKYPIHMT